MELRRWSPLTFVFPRRYVDRSEFWSDFDLEEWSRSSYEWVEDPWNGLLDFARRPAETISRGEGDCEDYALVALSWAVAHGRTGVGLAFCWGRRYPWPTHAIAFDDERVYSSGDIFTGSVEEWIADSRYSFALERRLS